MIKRLKGPGGKHRRGAPKKKLRASPSERPTRQKPAGYCRRLYELPRIGRLYPVDEE